MERQNHDLREPRDRSSQVPASERPTIAAYVEQVTAEANRLSDRVGTSPSHDYISAWRRGADIVAAAVAAGAGVPTEFTPSRSFIAFCDLDDFAGPDRARLRSYLIAETDRRLAAAIHDLLPPEDVALLIRVGRRHGRRATRSLLSTIVPYVVELEYGIAASVGTEIRRAMKEAA